MWCVYSKTTIYICIELRIIHVYEIYSEQKPYSGNLNRCTPDAYEQLGLF